MRRRPTRTAAGAALAAVLLTAGASAADDGRALAAPPSAVAAGAAPLVRQMVVFPSGDARLRAVRARAAAVRVGRRRCRAAAGTPLAALMRSRVARLSLVDYGSCSGRARDGGQLFVRAIGPARNRGLDGWVYKVGTRVGTAGAADPAGPFGRGRLRRGAEVTWFYCRLDTAARSCQRTLTAFPAAGPGGEVAVTVRAHDDRGSAVPAAGATVRAGATAATAGPDGVARLRLPPGAHEVVAELAGAVRSFPRRVAVG